DEGAMEIPVEVYNAFCDTLHDVSARYVLAAGDSVVYSVEENCGDIPMGKNNMLPGFEFKPSSVISDVPVKVQLRVEVDAANAPQARNSWDLWVYPAIDVAEASPGIYVADSLDSMACGVLARGGKVLLTAAGKVRFGSDVKQTYLPVFWNTSWFKMRPPHTTGASIDRDHPLFREFPTDEWANLNWWELLNNAQVINLEHFTAKYQPPVQPIYTWHVSRKLGMLVEANVLGGKLLMTTMDIDSDLDKRIVARQMRKAILDYMDSDRFKPDITLDEQVIADLFTKDADPVDMFTRESPDELKPKLK
ncbi:MAG: beta-glucuronidase, partial [Muribaculaceae bacterium]|nr:beta-glucuronidase [Muribaculaceae bacterium]